MDCCLKCNCSLPSNELFLLCFPHEDAPRRKSIRDLEGDWRRLKAERDSIEKRIRERSPQMVETVQVTEWLRQVAALESKIETLKINWETEQVIQNGNCFCDDCLQCKKKYCLWKQIQSSDRKVLDLLKQKPDNILERPALNLPQQVQTDPTFGMQPLLDEVWGHVVNQKEGHVRLIGLHGMGGVGKTTLLKAVNNKLGGETLHFDLHLWIDVSKTPNPVNIQNYIGENIGLRADDWKIKSPDEKARDIYNRIETKEYKYILLLDDIWKRFDFKEIGIPLPNSTNKSMVIFTTPNKQVCGQMEATDIQILCLDDEEAWNLFKKTVGEKTLNAHPNIPDRARVVMRECSGLPLALIAIGRAMTLKTTVHDWEHAINVLQGYTAEFPTMTDQVYTPLRRTYDNLTTDADALRSCFLSCSSYAKDEEILKIDLVDKWISKGFLGRFGDLKKDRDEGYSYITDLLNASLLEECLIEGKVKMHPVIRYMALWIVNGNA